MAYKNSAKLYRQRNYLKEMGVGYGTTQGSWLVMGLISCNTKSGNKPNTKIAPTKMNMGIKIRLSSRIALGSAAGLPYMTFTKRKI